jgi:hypothetical protein
MELAPPMLALYSYFVTMYIALCYYDCFIYYVIGLFYSFSLPYARLVVRAWQD